jgi:hypothetical protein
VLSIEGGTSKIEGDSLVASNMKPLTLPSNDEGRQESVGHKDGSFGSSREQFDPDGSDLASRHRVDSVMVDTKYRESHRA